MACRLLALLILALAVLVSPVESVRAQNPETPFSERASDWNGDMDVIEELLKNTELSAEAGEPVKKTLNKVINEATQARDRAAATLSELNARLEALGPPPEGENAVPEPDPVAKERSRLNESISEAKSQVSLADLAITRATNLVARIGQEQRTRLAAQLMEQGPLPYLPDTIATVPDTVAQYVANIALTAVGWWQALPDDERSGGFLTAAAFFLVGVAAAWWLRAFVLRRFGPYPVEEPPPYSRRLLAAIADGVARGILPAAILGVIILRTQADGSPFQSDFGTILRLAAESLMVFVLVTALPHSVFSPEDPSWRLTGLEPEKGQQILHLIRPLALLFCVDEFVLRTGDAVPQLSDVLSVEFQSVWTFGMCLAQGLLTLALLRPSLWKTDDEIAQDRTEDPDETDEEEEGVRSVRRPFWKATHALLVLLTLVGTLAPALGYINLGDYLLNNLLGSAILVSILYILRGLFREVIGLVTGSTVVRDRLAVRHKTRSRLKFVTRFLLDVAIFILGLSIIAPNWGVSESDMLHGMRIALSGLQIGNVTISLTDILLAVFVFIAALALIRALKRSLAEKILPETEIEESLRHSITAGIGYVGFVVAAALAVAVAGVDLTNIALIAGALSVGIGFGLQNIVNNFVSGLILLIERPIKVGDWVVVGSNEGFVKQINMRATEIETWQKASVIVPNADLLSQALKNWTHKDKIGRVDIPIGVALDSDIDKVCDILLEIAREHPRCRRYPEPVALVMNVGESRIDMEIRLFTSDILWVVWIASDVRKEILRRFPQEGIVIPYAQRVVHLVENGDPAQARLQAVTGQVKSDEATDATPDVDRTPQEPGQDAPR
ncbi:MAG: mechanosensitive ion channel [Alphaproteobacteria bacterium]|nr:mechanosensitive ion channel [Alphaproteobacteria bacterium]